MPESVAGAFPRLTVCLVTWNGREAVSDLLAAIDAFTRGPIELIVVDNASTDGTLALLRQRLGKPGFRLVENPTNKRCASATNQAIGLCRTELICYLCAAHAMVAGDGWDEAVVRAMDARPDVDLAGDVWNPYGFDLHGSRFKPGWTPAMHGRDRLSHVQGGAWIARRRVFDELGGFAEDEFPHGQMDVELSYRLLSHGRGLGALAEFACPPAPEEPVWRPEVRVFHPASPLLRQQVRLAIGSQGRTVEVGDTVA